MEIVLIDIGVFQEYILDNIRNLKLFGNDNITVITDQCIIHNFKDINVVSTSLLDSCNFDSKNKLTPGFWANTSKRLFYLYSYMKQFNRTKIIHIENDYTIYFNTRELKYLEDKVWLTMDSPNRCIPGIVIVPRFELLEPLLNNYDFGSNDMVNMARFYNNNKNTVNALPIINNESFQDWGMIFDAAAMGQYLGGIDTIHAGGGVPGFVNETCIFDYSKYTFHWVKENTLFVPMVKIDNVLYKVAGLHIHSKRLFNFQADDPKENRLIKLI